MLDAMERGGLWAAVFESPLAQVPPGLSHTDAAGIAEHPDHFGGREAGHIQYGDTQITPEDRRPCPN